VNPEPKGASEIPVTGIKRCWSELENGYAGIRRNIAASIR
jgi:hypothetical protein